MTKPRYRQLPAYVPDGAKRDTWQYIVDDVRQTGEPWSYFRVNALPEAIHAQYGRTYHQGTISRALRDLSAEQYIEYRSGSRGQVSMARPVASSGADDLDPGADRGGA